ncbi:hypothetical protein Sjap_018864 [Stephania japonica]|uniref:Uncharacterized protein n=1 Tax=Stephania japonica TaxID=461633 RepID=A0AAP0I8U2_9MAGN
MGWRRAFCTTISRDAEIALKEKNHKNQQQQSPSPSPRSFTKISNGGSSPSTPRFQSQQPVSSPSLRCKTTTSKKTTTTTTNSTNKSPRLFGGSNPSSPRSPFSLFKAGLRFSKSNCGVCLQSMKTGHGTAIFTAECSHAFHFPCIAAHVRNPGPLLCPVCGLHWRQVPLLSSQKNQQEEEQVVNNNNNNNESPRINQSKPSDQRSYDDDEPLMLLSSPTSRFNTIPEGDDEEGIEEFQGFFVDPKLQSSTSSINGGDSREVKSVEVSLAPESALVSAGRSHETYALVLKVKAHKPPAAAQASSRGRRAPIDLVTVLDVSGSMTGAKLHMLKRAMRLVIASLGSADRLSIVAFSSAPKRLLPLVRMTAAGQRAALRIIDRLVCGQGSSVAEALRKATKVLEDRRDRNPVASIMLLSDGQEEGASSNQTSRRRPTTHVSSTRFAHLEIPVHSFGFSQEPAEDAFAKCVGGLLSVVVQDLKLQIGFSTASAAAEISAVYSCTGRPAFLGTNSVPLGDLYAEEERELLLELRVPSAALGANHVFSVRCNYKDPVSQELFYGKDQVLVLPRLQAVRSSAPKIERLRNMFVTVRAVAEGRRLVDHNELPSAYHLLASARGLLVQSSSAAEAEEYLRVLEAELAEIQWRRQQLSLPRRRASERDPSSALLDENGDPLTPTSAWRAAERLAKVAMMRKSMNRVSDLHGFENARF